MAVCRNLVGFTISGIPSWITPNFTSSNDHSASNFRYTVAKNTGAYRSATITVTPNRAAGGGYKSTFTVKQAASVRLPDPTPPPPPTVAFSTTPANLEFNAAGRPAFGIAKITVTCAPGVRWSVSPNGAAIAGIVYRQSTSVGPGNVVITDVNPNSSSRDQSGYIDIICNGTSRRTYVKQYKGAQSIGYGPSGGDQVMQRAGFNERF